MQKNKVFHLKNSVLTFWRSSLAELRRIRSIAGAGVLVALGVVLNQFTLAISPVVEIGFAFLALGVSGFLYGPLVAGFGGVIMDLVGYLFRPNGTFFFGFIFNEFISGVLYGCWLYKKPVKLWRVFGACASTLLLCSFILNPLWFNIMYGKSFVIITSARLIKNAIVLPINTFLLYLMVSVTNTQKKLLTP